MDMIVITFVGILCAYVAVSIFSSQERNQVFNRRPIEVVDVKKYNRFCGFLVIGFGLAVEVTLFLGFLLGGVVSVICTLVIILEAFLVLMIYSKQEKQMLKKR